MTWHLHDLDVPSLGSADYVLPGGASLATGLTDAANLPVPARVRLYQGTFSWRELIEGTPAVEVTMQTANPYQVELAPGRYWAVLSSYEYQFPRYSRVAERVIVEDESDLVASLPSPGETGLLTGTVTTGDGSEATSATLYAYESGLGLLAEAGVAAGSKYELFLPSGVYEMAARTYSPDVGFTSYVLGRIEVDGDRTWNITLGEATSVAEAPGAVPHRFALEQNYPNPFNAETVIEFSVEKDVLAELTLYDLLGQRVRILFSDWLTAGPHAVRWDGRDEAGKGVATGVYLYRLEAAEKVAARKLLFLR